MTKNKYVKTFESFEQNELIPIGARVKQEIGIGGLATIIPWFSWRNATDGTYKQPDKDEQVAVEWDGGKIGFAYAHHLTIINKDGSEEELGRYISDEDYDKTGDIFDIFLGKSAAGDGHIEFDDGSIDNFIIRNDGKISFDNWYPVDKSNKLIKAIKKEQKEQE